MSYQEKVTVLKKGNTACPNADENHSLRQEMHGARNPGKLKVQSP